MRAAQLPTLPKPWTAKVAPSIGRPRSASAHFAHSATPRPVASSRPSEPCIDTGLPVTTPGWKPWYLPYWSAIQAIVWALVLTSGAGMSSDGPMITWIWSTNFRVSRCSSPIDSVFGSTVTPPLPPPNGMPTTAVFQVIRLASALTSSSLACGW